MAGHLGVLPVADAGGGEASESPLTDDDIAWARSHFIEYVRAGGPLPAVRIGKQPYGILPVTSLDAWKPPTGQEKPVQARRRVAGFADPVARSMAAQVLGSTAPWP